MKTIDVKKLAALVRAHALAELDDNRIGVKEVVVHRDGRPAYHEIFGLSGETPPGGFLYRVASMTKPVTAAAVAQLWDRGRLDLSEPAWHYYPGLRRMQVAEVRDGRVTALRPAKNEIRVADLLSHTTGIGCGPVTDVLPDPTARLPRQAAAAEALRLPLSFEPLTAQAYSATLAFDLAAGIVEQVSGLAFEAYLRKNLFDPLGMTDTTFAPTPAQWARMVPMHDRTAEGKSATAETPPGCVFEGYTPERAAAGAGLASTAADYIRFADMLCMGGVSADGTRVLSEAAVRRMATPNVPETVDMGCERWGLGMRIIVSAAYPHGLGVGCFGWSGAYGTHFWVDPENRLAVVMMKNSRFDGGAGNRSACELERDVSASLR